MYDISKNIYSRALELVDINLPGHPKIKNGYFTYYNAEKKIAAVIIKKYNYNNSGNVNERVWIALIESKYIDFDFQNIKIKRNLLVEKYDNYCYVYDVIFLKSDFETSISHFRAMESFHSITNRLVPSKIYNILQKFKIFNKIKKWLKSKRK